MRASSFARVLGATALVGGLSLTVAPTAVAAPAEISGTVNFACTMPDFGPSADFTYDATTTVKGVRDSEGSSPVTLVATLSDMPGVVPPFISLKAQDVQVTLAVTVDGTAATLKGAGKTDVNPTGDMKTKDPVKLPGNIQGTVATTATDLEVAVTAFDFNVAGVGGSCKATAATLGTVTPELGKAPAPDPTPTPTPSPSPTEAPEPTDDAGTGQGKPAKGKVTFGCTLSAPFNTKFDYVADVAVHGARAAEGDSKVSLAADFSKMPGLAPVAINDGKMRVESKGSVDGKAVTFTGNSTVNAGPNEAVAVPRMSASVDTDATTADVKLDSFRFEFDEMQGLAISAECSSTKGAAVGAMTIGVGDVDEPGDGNGDGGGGGDAGGTTAGGTTTLPKTGGGDAMPVIALWALALGVVGAGLLVWMPAQRRSAS